MNEGQTRIQMSFAPKNLDLGGDTPTPAYQQTSVRINPIYTIKPDHMEGWWGAN